MIKFKVGHFYKGINPDGTKIIYEVLEIRQNHADIKIVIDHDGRLSRRIPKTTHISVGLNVVLVTKENKWVTQAREITDTSELIAVVL